MCFRPSLCNKGLQFNFNFILERASKKSLENLDLKVVTDYLEFVEKDLGTYVGLWFFNICITLISASLGKSLNDWLNKQTRGKGMVDFFWIETTVSSYVVCTYYVLWPILKFSAERVQVYEHDAVT